MFKNFWRLVIFTSPTFYSTSDSFFNIQKSNIVIVNYLLKNQKLSFKKNYNNIFINFQKLTLFSSFTKCILLNINVPPLSLSHEPKKDNKINDSIAVLCFSLFDICLYLTIFIFCDLKNKFISGDKLCMLI
jgi:hypothetical protein